LKVGLASQLKKVVEIRWRRNFGVALF